MKKPKHKDMCEHGADCYVGTFSNTGYFIGGQVEYFDVYVYDGGTGQEVCIRYGSEGSEYFSPGSLSDFLRKAAISSTYRDAADLLCEKGKIRWIPKSEDR